MNKEIDTIKKITEDAIRSNIPLKSMWEIDHKVYANNLFLYTDSGQLYFNNERI